MKTQVNGTRVVKTKSLKRENLMNEFYGNDPKKAELAEKALVAEGKRLMDAIRVKHLSSGEVKGDKHFVAFQKLINYCASEIARNGITKTEKNGVPAPIRLMNTLKQQAKDTLGEFSTGAQEIIATWKIVNESTRAAERQQKIMEIVKKAPANVVQEFVEAVKRNNLLTQKQIKIEMARTKQLSEYFPHTSSESTIKLDEKEDIVSQIEDVEEKDNQLQSFKDVEISMRKLRKIEKEKEEFIKAFENSQEADKENFKKNIDSCESSIENLKKKINVSINKIFDKNSQRKIKKLNDSTKSYKEKMKSLSTYIKQAERERNEAYTFIGKSVLTSIDSKGSIDDKAYPEEKLLALRAQIMDLVPGYRGKKSKAKAQSKGKAISKKADKTKKNGLIADEDIKNIAREELKNYVYFVQDLKKASEKKSKELEDAMADRNDFIAELQGKDKTIRNFEELANKQYTMSDVQNWLDEKSENGDDLEEKIMQVARKNVIESYKGNSNPVARWMNGIRLFFKKITKNGRNEFNNAIIMEEERIAKEIFDNEKAQEIKNKEGRYNEATAYVRNMKKQLTTYIAESDTAIQNYALKRAQGKKTEEAIAQRIVDVAVDSTVRSKDFDDILKADINYNKLKKNMEKKSTIKLHKKKVQKKSTEPYLSF